MSQEIHDKMKQDLETMFNIISNKQERAEEKRPEYWAERANDKAPNIQAFASIIEAYAKLELVDEQKIANQIALKDKKTTTPVDWKK